ncbi:conserved membrane hypothetical protein [Rhodococcus ruber]|uniref:Nicotinamide mononucleotide transporter n=2 Tax=Rhodococcus ruber TaxID=1830 RepID=A0A098BJU2_9NOCA|nr:conserved membrane hypothetical protein [Rhodococcus ruber]
MIPVWWSIMLATIGIVGIYVTTRKLWWGFALGLAAQLLWIAYAIATAQYGFILSAIGYGIVYWIGARKWFHERNTTV